MAPCGGKFVQHIAGAAERVPTRERDLHNRQPYLRRGTSAWHGRTARSRVHCRRTGREDRTLARTPRWRY